MKNKYIFIIILILLWGCKKNINKSNDDLPSIYPLELSNVTKLDNTLILFKLSFRDDRKILYHSYP